MQQVHDPLVNAALSLAGALGVLTGCDQPYRLARREWSYSRETSPSRPGGWGAILEWFRIETETGPPLERRVDPGGLEDLARQAGFQIGEWRDLNGEQNLMELLNP